MKIPVVDTMTIVVPLYDNFGVDRIEDHIPCEIEHSVGYKVFQWNAGVGTFCDSALGWFENMKEARTAAEKLNWELCNGMGVTL